MFYPVSAPHLRDMSQDLEERGERRAAAVVPVEPTEKQANCRRKDFVCIAPACMVEGSR